MRPLLAREAEPTSNGLIRRVVANKNGAALGPAGAFCTMNYSADPRVVSTGQRAWRTTEWTTVQGR